MALFPSLDPLVARLRRDRQGVTLLGWALAGAAIAGLVGWSFAMAEKESRAHSITQAAW